MSGKTTLRAIRALKRQNEGLVKPTYQCVYVVGIHVCFEEYVAQAWYKQHNGRFKIERIDYKDVKTLDDTNKDNK